MRWWVLWFCALIFGASKAFELWGLYAALGVVNVQAIVTGVAIVFVEWKGRRRA